MKVSEGTLSKLPTSDLLLTQEQKIQMIIKIIKKAT